jgi:thiamine kinase-like enzyme
MKRFSSVAELTNPSALAVLNGPVDSVDTIPLNDVGYSGSLLHRMEVHRTSGQQRTYILKRTVMQTDWLSQRTSDPVGREAAILNDPFFSRVWEHIQCPYVAFAIQEGEIAVLMNDMSGYLFPDVREPIAQTTENNILNTLAALHASYWDSTELRTVSWLTRPYQYLEMVGPGLHPTDTIAPPPDKIGKAMEQGWTLALGLLSGRLKSWMERPAREIAATWKDLPFTFLHGDAKIANMAYLPEGKVVMFDWTHCGCGPCGIELGWYLAVNATRLATAKEQILSRYRLFLESHLQCRISETLWERMVDVAIITGARMMLWSKALGYQSGTPKGIAEWEWWLDRLGEVRI